MREINNKAYQQIVVFILLTVLSYSAAAETVSGQFLVSLKNLERYSVGSVVAGGVIQEKLTSTCALVKTEANKMFTVTDFTSQRDVMAVIPNEIIQLESESDERIDPRQWSLDNIGQEDLRKIRGMPNVDVNVLDAWPIEMGSSEVIVAVHDTGIDIAHPDLKNQIWVNRLEADGEPGVDDDGNGFIDDINGYDFRRNSVQINDEEGHGTHVAGIIAAESNGFGVTGVAPRIKLMPAGWIGPGGGRVSDGLRALKYAVDNGANVVNMSWGSYNNYNKCVEEAISEAGQKGVLVVTSAGNRGLNNDNVNHYPSDYKLENVVSVAAIDNRGRLAKFTSKGSNYGAKSVHIAAPGQKILSTYPGGRYVYLSGTSMAAPHVAGVAALLYSGHRGLSPAQVRERIMSGAKKLPLLRGKIRSGGTVDAAAAFFNVEAEVIEFTPLKRVWKTKEVAIESPHNYPPRANLKYKFRAQGALKLRFFFEKYDLERRDDFLTITTDQRRRIRLTGRAVRKWTSVMSGEKAELRLTSDRRIQKYGFKLNKVQFLVEEYGPQ